MTNPKFRRVRNALTLAALGALLLYLAELGERHLYPVPLASGWMLLALVAGLALYNVRKKLPFLPLGTSATWLQVHIYAGWLTTLVFLTHTGWRFPTGVFETVLAAVFTSVVATGALGILMSRSFARRMTTRGGEEIYERIPRRRRQLQREAEQLVLDCLARTESTAVPEFYTTRLKDYFERPRNLYSHLALSTRPRQRLLADMDAQRRYLNDDEKNTMQQIAEHVRTKDELDFQYAHQAALKYWLFLHVPLTYALLVFTTLHIILVYAFSGGSH